MKNITLRLGRILIVILVSCFHFLRSQDVKDETFHNLFDQHIGLVNTELYQGKIYVKRFKTSNEKTEFYKSPRYLLGSVNYNDQEYYSLNLRYDLFHDQLLLKLSNNAGGSTLQLFNEKLSHFSIGGDSFIKISEKLAPNLGVYGFYRLSFKGDELWHLLKLSKKKIERKSKKSLYYEFINDDSFSVIYHKGNYLNFKSKKEIVKHFPDLKKEIDQFYTTTRRLRKTKPDAFQVALWNHIDNLLGQKNNYEN